TIPPFAWFVEQIGGDDFNVNVLLPPGADHHIWEPLPAQISKLTGSEAFIMNGQLTFEHAWMGRFMQVNPGMKVLDLSRNIQLIGEEGRKSEGRKVGGEEVLQSSGPAVLQSGSQKSEGQKVGGEEDIEHHDADNEDHGHDHGSVDPHYWMSPVAAGVMAQDIRDFLVELNPDSSVKYTANLVAVNRKISEADSLLRKALASNPQGTVLIYHPALAYTGRDYGFEQVSFEDEGKNPSPARMKELIDLARDKKIKTIFIQAEYDVRNAESLSRETGARLVVINPMNPDWPAAVIEVAHALGSQYFGTPTQEEGQSRTRSVGTAVSSRQ
ncbi:MAG: zinc ABC transporter solute-binding protein, partial [Bacteroidales bacterium]|nr:zinc ABC transporter solute-binding protein [Bacteroidales bacterium]